MWPPSPVQQGVVPSIQTPGTASGRTGPGVARGGARVRLASYWLSRTSPYRGDISRAGAESRTAPPPRVSLLRPCLPFARLPSCHGLP